jgi:hypothetical protein
LTQETPLELSDPDGIPIDVQGDFVGVFVMREVGKRSKSPAEIAREFPHQVALKAVETPDQAERGRGIDAFIREHALKAAPRGMPIRIEGDWWRLYCFATEEDAIRFSAAFGGKRVDPSKRLRGTSAPREAWIKPLRS